MKVDVEGLKALRVCDTSDIYYVPKAAVISFYYRESSASHKGKIALNHLRTSKIYVQEPSVTPKQVRNTRREVPVMTKHHGTDSVYKPKNREIGSKMRPVMEPNLFAGLQ